MSERESVLSPWIQTCQVREQVRLREGGEDGARYAVHLGAFLRREASCPAYLLEPEHFFEMTFLSKHLQQLLSEVSDRLRGVEGPRVLQLRTPFGGGKTHAMVALIHWVRQGGVLDGLDSFGLSIAPKNASLAVLSGLDFDPLEGMQMEGGPRCRTLWGALAWYSGGVEAWRQMSSHDERRTAPGGALLAVLLKDNPTLILLDEVLLYIEKTMAISLGDSTFGRQNLLFLQTLTEVVRTLEQHAMVYSLQATGQEAVMDEQLLATLDQLVNRIDARRVPLLPDELSAVLRKHFFVGAVSEARSAPVIEAYGKAYRQKALLVDSSTNGKRRATRAANQFKKELQACYPFHPSLIRLLTRQWSTLPGYQRTRGALQLIELAVREASRRNSTALLLEPGALPLEEEAVRRVFCKQVGISEAELPCLSEDFFGAGSTLSEMEEWIKENDDMGVCVGLPRRLLTSLLLYSFGGVGLEDAGLTTEELQLQHIAPDEPQHLFGEVWEELLLRVNYLHTSQERHRFLAQPNLNRWLHEESRRFQDGQVEDEIGRTLKWRGRSVLGQVLWPEHSLEIPDGEAKILVVFLSAKIRLKTPREKLKQLREWVLSRGQSPRHYRNGLVFAMPSSAVWERLTRVTRLWMAARLMLKESKQHGLSEEERADLSVRLDAWSAEQKQLCVQLYDILWIPIFEEREVEKIRFERVELSALILRESQGAKRMLEALSQRYWISQSLKPEKVVRLLWPEEAGEPGNGRFSMRRLRDAFFSYLRFPRLVGLEVLSNALCEGVSEGVFGVLVGADGQDADGVDGRMYWKEDLPLSVLTWEQDACLVHASRCGSLLEEKEVAREGVVEELDAQGEWGLRLRLSLEQLEGLSPIIGPLVKKSTGVLIEMSLSGSAREEISARWMALRVKEPLLEYGVEIVELSKPEGKG